MTMNFIYTEGKKMGTVALQIDAPQSRCHHLDMCSGGRELITVTVTGLQHNSIVLNVMAGF